METRKLYNQGKSTVLVIPSKYLKALNWAPQDNIGIALLPNMTLNLSKGQTQFDMLKPTPQTPDQKKEAPNANH